MSFDTEISGKKANVLLDVGASHSFISKVFCKDADLKSVTASTPQQVRTAGGTEIMAHTLCQVSFQLQGMGITLSPLIVPLPDEFTVILGDDWLRSKEAVLNYADQTFSLRRNERGKRHILHTKGGKLQNKRKWTADLMLLVEDVEDTPAEPADFSKVPVAYRDLLKKYKDAFPADLPAGLPPKKVQDSRAESLELCR